MMKKTCHFSRKPQSQSNLNVMNISPILLKLDTTKQVSEKRFLFPHENETGGDASTVGYFSINLIHNQRCLGSLFKSRLILELVGTVGKSRVLGRSRLLRKKQQV